MFAKGICKHHQKHLCNVKQYIRKYIIAELCIYSQNLQSSSWPVGPGV